MKNRAYVAALAAVGLLACSEQPDSPTEETKDLLTPGVTWSAKSFQFFANSSALLPSGWDIVTNTNGFRPNDVATDGEHAYLVGHNFASRWRIQKRRLSSGFLTDAFIGDATTAGANAIALNAGHMFIVGETDGGALRIEKRFLDDISLDLTFGPSTAPGVVVGGSGFSPKDVAIDDSFMYVVGAAGIIPRIEKRRLSNGELEFQITQGGWLTTNEAVAIDDSFMYVVGSGTASFFGSKRWRIEKRQLSDGALVATFGTAGVIPLSSLTSGPANAIAVSGDQIIVTGRSSSGDFLVRRYSRTTGALVEHVASAAASGTPLTIAVDGEHYYLGGSDDSGDIRIEKRALVDDALDNNFATAGVFTGNAVSVESRAIVVSGDSLYSVGVNNNAARLQRLFQSDGGTSIRLGLPRLGAPLAGVDSRVADDRSQTAFRLRVELQPDGADVEPGDDSFLLKVALKDEDTCAEIDAGDWSIIYPDFGTIRTFDDSWNANGDRATTVHPNRAIPQSYNEQTGFTTLLPIEDGGRGVFDFALQSSGAAAGATYCFKVTDHDGNDMAHDRHPEYVPNPHPTISSTVLNTTAVNITGAIGFGNRMARVNIDLEKYPDAICNDGTTAALFVRRGTEDTDKWIVHMIGGGGCTDGQSCADRWSSIGTNFSSRQMSTKDLVPSAAESGVLGAHALSPFRTHNLALLKFCSSDGWSGTSRGRQVEALDPVTQVPVKMTINVMGHRILDAMLETLRHKYGQVVVVQDGVSTVIPNLDNAAEVVLSGSSGGGGGATRHLDWLAARAAVLGTTVRGIFDASTNVDRSNPDLDWAVTTLCATQGICSYTASMASRDEIATVFREGFNDQSCLDTAPNVHRCQDNHYLQKNHITTEFLVRDDQSDPLHMKNFFGMEFEYDGTFTPPGLTSIDLVITPNPTCDVVIRDQNRLVRSVYAQIAEADMAGFANVPTNAVEASNISFTPAVFHPRCGFHEALTSNPKTWVRVDAGGARMSGIWNNFVGGAGPTAFLAAPLAPAICRFEGNNVGVPVGCP